VPRPRVRAAGYSAATQRAMIVPIPPAPADAPPQRARCRDDRALADEDDALLRRLDAGELYDIHQGLEWCDRELRALEPLRLAERRRVAAMRRRWAHRWRVATGRPAVSLQAHRAWRIAAIVGAGATLVALLDGPAEYATPPPDRVVIVPPEAAFPGPAASPAPTPAPVEPIPADRPVLAVDDTTARAWARRGARGLERCRRARLTLVGCDAVVAGDLGGRVAIAALSESTFRITAESSSGNTFTVDRAVDGVIHRTCTVADVRRCPRSGRW
jgi:hypothetical protein